MDDYESMINANFATDLPSTELETNRMKKDHFDGLLMCEICHDKIASSFCHFFIVCAKKHV